jgi:hypothetical protein
MLTQVMEFLSFFFEDLIIFYYVYVPYFVYPSFFHEHLGQFHLLAIMTTAPLYTSMQTSLQVLLHSFGYIFRSKTARSPGNSYYFPQ